MVSDESPQVRRSSCPPGEGVAGMVREGWAGNTAQDAAGSMAQVGSELLTTGPWLPSGVKLLACMTANRGASTKLQKVITRPHRI